MNEVSSPSFGAINYIVIFAYLVATAVIGMLFSARNKSTDDYFRGGQRVPAIVAGLSIFACLLSSLTFMSVPALAYNGDWSYSLSSLSAYLIIAPVVIFFYLPLCRKLDITTAYEYLERRFNYSIRVFGSISFMLLQFFRIAIILYLPALAFSTIAGIPMEISVLVVGVLCLILTIFGGMSAVVWTEALQAVVLFGAALTAILAIVSRVDGGVATVFNIALEQKKFFGQVPVFDGTRAGLAVILVGGFFINLVGYTTQQDMVQRYMTTKDLRSAAHSIWINAVVGIIGVVIFFLLGTMIYVFYHTYPEQLSSGVANDAIVPYFIHNELPVGIAGLVVAGIFAAAQSSISGSLNSLATTWIVDIHRRINPELSDKGQLVLAKKIVAVVGMAAIGVAYGLKFLNVVSLFDVMLTVGGLVMSSLGGVFCLGMLTRRGNSFGAVVGVIVSVSVLTYLWIFAKLSFWFYSPIGFLIAFGVGWIASLLRSQGIRCASQEGGQS